MWHGDHQLLTPKRAKGLNMAIYSINSLADKIREDKVSAAKAARATRVAELKDWASSQKWEDVRFLAWQAVPEGDDATLKILSDIDFLVYEKVISDQARILDWPFLGSDKDILLTLVAEGQYKKEKEEAKGYW